MFACMYTGKVMMWNFYNVSITTSMCMWKYTHASKHVCMYNVYPSVYLFIHVNRRSKGDPGFQRRHVNIFLFLFFFFTHFDNEIRV